LRIPPEVISRGDGEELCMVKKLAAVKKGGCFGQRSSTVLKEIKKKHSRRVVVGWQNENTAFLEGKRQRSLRRKEVQKKVVFQGSWGHLNRGKEA